jgi:hypothetical protein
MAEVFGESIFNGKVTAFSGIEATDISVSGSSQLLQLDVFGNVKTTGITTSSKFVVPSGNSSQFLKADGSLDPTTYLTSGTLGATPDNVVGQVVTRSGTGGFSAGIITATTFSGNHTGPITGPVTGNINSSGVSTITTLQTNSVQTTAGKTILNTTGSVLQVSNLIKTDQFTTTSASPVDVTGLSTSITPSSASSKILVIAWVVISTSGGGGDGYVRLMRGATSIGNGDGGFFGQSAGQDYFAGHSKPITYLDSPASTSALTYKIQAWGANTSYVNGRGLNGDFVTSSGITLMEISG